ncbi:Histone deacetylase hda1 [Saitozyma podzolica]|uniref:histone deacetylase n=1 Tax=Saitozyma podzolica TaxID=1890683 RepID=A0A427YUF4_9TREE|nr:Histone deacetylase hda1 [Saitozyma podzolica]
MSEDHTMDVDPTPAGPSQPPVSDAHEQPQQVDAEVEITTAEVVQVVPAPAPEAISGSMDVEQQARLDVAAVAAAPEEIMATQPSEAQPADQPVAVQLADVGSVAIEALASYADEPRREGESMAVDEPESASVPAVIPVAAQAPAPLTAHQDADHPLPSQLANGDVPAVPALVPPPSSESPFLVPGAQPSASGHDTQISSINTNANTSASLPKTITRTGFVYDMQMMLHCQDGYIPTTDDVLDSGEGHPEEPMRIKRIFARLREAGLIGRMKKLPIEQVTEEQVALVHAPGHWDKVQGTEFMTDEFIQESKHYYEQLSLVCKGEVRNAFAIVRPPGHHAEPDEHMGFCFFNNVAVAAKEVQRQGLAKKVLILDWDVHHGNGTQRAFWDDPDVLYISIHRHDGGRFYPTSDFGALDMVGTGAGEGKSVNIPWPCAGFGDADYIYAFQRIVMPIAYEFAPDLVIISAGFDAAEGDALGQCLVTPPAYGHMTHMLCALAGGKVVVALEGGYNLNAISNSSLAVAQVLLGETPAELGPLEASEIATEVIWQVAKVQSKFWKSIDVKSCEPPEVNNTEEEKPVVGIPDLLKIHRAHHMFTKHGLYQIPLASSDLESAFGGQVICSEGVYEPGVLVVFVHDFGNLRVETDGVSTTNVQMENSYLLDTSDTVVNWVKSSKYSLVDVNILRQFPTQYAQGAPKMVSKSGPELEARLLRYLWDNYIELSEAENVVLIGHGAGCAPLMDLVNTRDVQGKVKAIVQVAGMHSIVRIDPNNETRRAWFRKVNQIWVPETHSVLDDERVRRRLGDQIFSTSKAKVVDVLNHALPEIQSFVASKLPTRIAEPEQAVPLTNGHVEVDVNGSAAGPSTASAAPPISAA